MPLLRNRSAAAVLALLVVMGCASAGHFLQELFKERPPLALESLQPVSDARVDSTGRLLGSFVGEGTVREVHLISTDTGLIATLLRRGERRGSPGRDLWQWLDSRGVVALDLNGAAPVNGLVGSPDGHSVIRLRAALIRGGMGFCGATATAQAELIVDDARGGGPSLRGPVLASFRETDPARGELGYRDEPPMPGPDLLASLVARGGRAVDSVLARRLSRADLPLAAITDRYELNGLGDLDAIDVAPFRVDADRIRYAVSLRVSRLTAGGDTVVGSSLMVFDSAGAWQQFVFRPTAVRLRRGRLVPYPGLPALLWHRLTPLDAFAFDRDDLWLEQQDLAHAVVTWGVMEPRMNVIVAAAEVAGPCRS